MSGGPICPKCGDEFTEPWELGLRDGEVSGIQCASCGADLLIECAIDVSYAIRERRQYDFRPLVIGI